MRGRALLLACFLLPALLLGPATAGAAAGAQDAATPKKKATKKKATKKKAKKKVKKKVARAACLRTSTAVVTIRLRRREKLRSAKLYVGKKRVRTLRKKQLRKLKAKRGRVTVKVLVRKIPKGRFRVTVRAVTNRKRKLRRFRVYRRCAVSGKRLVIPGCADDTRFRGGTHPGGEWRWYGHDYKNSRVQPKERAIGRENAASLGQVWTFSVSQVKAAGDFTGTPTVADGCVFVGSNRGWVFALNGDTGKVAWKTKAPDGQINGSVTAPGDGKVYVAVSAPPPTSANCIGPSGEKGCIGPHVLALDERDGKVLWKSPGLDDQVGSDIYASPMVFDLTDNGKDDPVLFTGISGWGAESGGITPGSSGDVRYNYDGSFAILDAKTGTLLQKTYTVANDKRDKHAGCGIWSTPAIDRESGVAYVGTSNPFRPESEHPHCNAVLRIGVNRGDRGTFGRILGSYKATNEDYVSHFIPGYPCVGFGSGTGPTPSQELGNCPDMDLSVGASPNLFHDSKGRKMVGVGQKSGIYHALEAPSMKGVWTQTLGAPTLIGGIVGSTAYDGRNIYGPNTAPGYVWSVKKDDGAIRWMGQHAPGYGNPTAVANGVAYTSDQGGMLNGYETEGGNQLLQYQLGNETQGGVAIARNTVYAAIGTTSQPDGKIVALRPGGRPEGGDGGQQPPSGPGGGPGGGGGPVTATIVAGPQNLFYTQRLAAPVSGQLTFANLDTQAHDVVSRATGPDGGPLFRSPLVGSRQTAPVNNFNRATPGQTYPFFCTIHPGMTGEVLATP